MLARLDAIYEEAVSLGLVTPDDDADAIAAKLDAALESALHVKLGGRCDDEAR